MNKSKSFKKSVLNEDMQNDVLDKKTDYFIELIQRTILHIDKMKKIDVITNEFNSYITKMLELSESLKATNKNLENRIELLQKANNEMSSIFKIFGTELLEDILLVCCGSNVINDIISGLSDSDKNKMTLLMKYFHPTSYNVVCQKKSYKLTKNLDTDDIDILINSFHLNVHGIQVLFNNCKKKIIITGIIDNVNIDLIRNEFITNKYNDILSNIPCSKDFQEEMFSKYLKSLHLKDFILYESDEIHSKYFGYLSNLNMMKNKSINNLVKDFLSSSLTMKRLIIIQLLISCEYECNHLAYLLFDLLPNEVNNVINNHDQKMILDSFTWQFKEYFRHAIINVNSTINDIVNSESRKIPLEHQICLMKVSDDVKEKAFQKLKEIKVKDNSGANSHKALTYLEGLLKIPFGNYKKEPIMLVMSEIKNNYCEMMNIENNEVNSLEILTNIKKINNNLEDDSNKKNKLILKQLTKLINDEIQLNKLEIKPIKLNSITNKDRMNFIFCFLSMNKDKLISEKVFKDNNMLVSLYEIDKKYKEITNYISNVRHYLDNSIHGHEQAKCQLETIICQWINGKQDGYCFGFEGPPGVGKTTLAKKGLSKCLLDENGESRPFGLIQIGGNAGGSTLQGHGYTYHGSTWGSIVQILMDKKCMNPIIFIDEVDKISKTEYGREITSILTHLLDSTQNDCFQDKYFSGIDLDLSKALFILSYNDVSLIDPILLDRIHRIKFKGLSIKEKMEISRNYILPEIYDKVGLKGAINISDDIIKYLIDNYTSEAGVRKLKELLFEIIGEINLEILKNSFDFDSYPVNIKIDDIKNKYFKNKRNEIKITTIENENKVGIINGLWANMQGKGGILKIQTNWRPSEKFMQLHLTGMQGDVMKESMNVALTLAWNLTSKDIQNKIWNEQVNGLNGIHIHCPEGATPKDGPSAGTAITVCVYSLINNLKIKSNIAMTGEITLDGNVTEIGGLDVKIIGGIKGGATEFIYPSQNEEDFVQFMEIFGKEEMLKNIIFHKVDRIEEVFELIFE
jgi:ATP-dependent Lon protease